MLGLPQNTILNKQLSKKAIYANFDIRKSQRECFDEDISRIMITNEISSATVNIAEGGIIKSIFVLLIELKHSSYHEKNIVMISKLIPQNILFVLQYGDNARLAIYHKSLIQSDWNTFQDLSIELKGLSLEAVWNNLVIQVGDIHIEQGNTLDEQIEIDERQRNIQEQIDALERKVRAEKQPSKKFELVQEIKRIKNKRNGF
jgi:hypothetical protein